MRGAGLPVGVCGFGGRARGLASRVCGFGGWAGRPAGRAQGLGGRAGGLAGRAGAGSAVGQARLPARQARLSRSGKRGCRSERCGFGRRAGRLTGRARPACRSERARSSVGARRARRTGMGVRRPGRRVRPSGRRSLADRRAGSEARQAGLPVGQVDLPAGQAGSAGRAPRRKCLVHGSGFLYHIDDGSPAHLAPRAVPSLPTASRGHGRGKFGKLAALEALRAFVRGGSPRGRSVRKKEEPS